MLRCGRRPERLDRFHYPSRRRRRWPSSSSRRQRARWRQTEPFPPRHKSRARNSQPPRHTEPASRQIRRNAHETGGPAAVVHVRRRRPGAVRGRPARDQPRDLSVRPAVPVPGGQLGQGFAPSIAARGMADSSGRSLSFRLVNGPGICRRRPPAVVVSSHRGPLAAAPAVGSGSSGGGLRLGTGGGWSGWRQPVRTARTPGRADAGSEEWGRVKAARTRVGEAAFERFDAARQFDLRDRMHPVAVADSLARHQMCMHCMRPWTQLQSLAS